MNKNQNTFVNYSPIS